jgi:DNA segregation ATPase FtsK/SpoIIIE-like protein
LNKLKARMLTMYEMLHAKDNHAVNETAEQSIQRKFAEVNGIELCDGALDPNSVPSRPLSDYDRSCLRVASVVLSAPGYANPEARTIVRVLQRLAATPERDLYAEAVRLVEESGRLSVSLVQRRLGISWNEAVAIIERIKAENAASTLSRPQGE